MIRVCCVEIPDKRFPDGTSAIKMPNEVIDAVVNSDDVTVEWLYENDAELLNLIYIRGWLRDNVPEAKVTLIMPYIPNARNDRTPNDNDVHTLRYFCDVINSLDFIEVISSDAHSSVATALLNRAYEESSVCYIASVVAHIEHETGEPIAFFYPDEGSMKRYSNIWQKSFKDFKRPFSFGIKKRDWQSGQIEGLQLIAPEHVKDKHVLIIDDICSKGGTFFHATKALKEAGAKNVYLWVTHCENTILSGDLINLPEMTKVFTTDSIFTGKHDKIEAVQVFR